MEERPSIFKTVPAKTAPDPERIKAARAEYERKRAQHYRTNKRIERLHKDLLNKVNGG